jgi:beta-galactosidase/beta-glucuronidase
MWYQKRFEVPDEWRNQRVHLHFGAVDYAATVWLNGRFLVEHEGGHTPFSADITNLIVEGEQILTVRVTDDPLDMEKPRGKQDWEAESHQGWYPRTTGIWQPVWIEPVSPTHITSLRITPNVSHFCLEFDVQVAGAREDLSLDIQLRLGKHTLAEDTWNLIKGNVCRSIKLPDPGEESARRAFLWRPEHPTLFDLTLTLRYGMEILDKVESYAALRSVEIRNGAVYLNERPYFLQFVLDQGYWPESHLAVPKPEAFKRDIELTKELGFNGVRKHQKIEDPRYLYWADRLGLVVWAEMPSFFHFSEKSARRMVREFMDVLKRDYNHPSIIAWVPFNRSWGLPDLQNSPTEQHFVRSIFHLAKALDPTRLVVDNDGWEHLETDILTIHDYMNDPDLFNRRYGTYEALEKTLHRRPVGRDLSLDGFAESEPVVILSEFGGIHLKSGDGWGYIEVRSPEEFLQRFGTLVESVSKSALAGFCYTQLTDTFQEQTGLLDADRRPKVEPEAIAGLLKSCVKQRTAAEI